MAKVISHWRTGHFHFVEDSAALAQDLVGPLPTRRFLMIGFTAGASPDDLISKLGGERAHLLAVPASDYSEDPSDLVGAGPEEQFLLERLRAADDPRRHRRRKPV